MRTTLLFAAPVWAAAALATNGTVRGDYTGKLGTFHRRKLRTILQVGTNIRNEIVYILACQWPLQVYIAKQLFRYGCSLDDNKRLASKLK